MYLGRSQVVPTEPFLLAKSARIAASSHGSHLQLIVVGNSSAPEWRWVFNSRYGGRPFGPPVFDSDDERRDKSAKRRSQW